MIRFISSWPRNHSSFFKIIDFPSNIKLTFFILKCLRLMCIRSRSGRQCSSSNSFTYLWTKYPFCCLLSYIKVSHIISIWAWSKSFVNCWKFCSHWKYWFLFFSVIVLQITNRRNILHKSILFYFSSHFKSVTSVNSPCLSWMRSHLYPILISDIKNKNIYLLVSYILSINDIISKIILNNLKKFQFYSFDYNLFIF